MHQSIRIYRRGINVSITFKLRYHTTRRHYVPQPKIPGTGSPSHIFCKMRVISPVKQTFCSTLLASKRRLLLVKILLLRLLTEPYPSNSPINPISTTQFIQDTLLQISPPLTGEWALLSKSLSFGTHYKISTKQISPLLSLKVPTPVRFVSLPITRAWFNTKKEYFQNYASRITCWSASWNVPGHSGSTRSMKPERPTVSSLVMGMVVPGVERISLLNLWAGLSRLLETGFGWLCTSWDCDLVEPIAEPCITIGARRDWMEGIAGVLFSEGRESCPVVLSFPYEIRQSLRSPTPKCIVKSWKFHG